MRIDIYSDTICPWCYLGKRRFELALAARPQLEARVRWRPFELNPDLAPGGMDRAAYLISRPGDPERQAQAELQLQELGLASGITFRFDLIKRLPNTRWSHLLIAHAERLGIQQQVQEQVMRAYFEDGRDIGDIEELVRIGVDAGMPQSDARRTLVLRAGQDGIVAAERHAQVLGITGVPTFIFDGQYTISGAQDVAGFAQVFDQMAELTAGKGGAA